MNAKVTKRDARAFGDLKRMLHLYTNVDAYPELVTRLRAFHELLWAKAITGRKYEDAYRKRQEDKARGGMP